MAPTRFLQIKHIHARHDPSNMQDFSVFGVDSRTEARAQVTLMLHYSSNMELPPTFPVLIWYFSVE